MRKCNLCKDDIGDEYHFLLTCKKLKGVRKEYLKTKYIRRPNVFKYESLMNSKNKRLLITIAKFIKIIYEMAKAE